MPIATVNKSLYTPDGEIPLYEKGVVQINRQELIMLSRLHEFAQKHQLTIVCKRCDHAITGQNAGRELQPGVSCQCSEFRFTG